MGPFQQSAKLGAQVSPADCDHGGTNRVRGAGSGFLFSFNTGVDEAFYLVVGRMA